MPWFAYATKVATLGIANFETGELIIKDKLIKNFDDGVWLGKTPFNNMGISSYAI